MVICYSRFYGSMVLYYSWFYAIQGSMVLSYSKFCGSKVLCYSRFYGSKVLCYSRFYGSMVLCYSRYYGSMLFKVLCYSMFYGSMLFKVLWFYAIQGSMVLWFYDSMLFKVLWQQLQDELRRTKWSKIRWNHQQSNPANWVSDVRRTDPRTVKHTNTPNQENMIITDSCVWSGLTSGTNLWGQLFKCNLMGFWSSDWIKSWKFVVQKTKKDSEFGLDHKIHYWFWSGLNPQFVLFKKKL